MYKRGNDARRDLKRKAKPRVGSCRRCEAQWTFLGNGRLSALCHGCSQTHRWCHDCDLVKPLDCFHRNGADRVRRCKECQSLRAKLPQVKQYSRWRRILDTYGLTRDAFEAMVEAQGGRCGLCGELPTELVVDHCHTTGKIRTLLCRPCNTSIGIFGDDPIRLQRALDYLLAHQN